MNRLPWLAAVAALIALAVWCGAAAPLSAQTLDEALGAAYLSNPQLRSARAQLRATDEQVPQALSGWRPTVEVTGEIGNQRQNFNHSSGFPDATTTPKQAAVTVTQPIYRGGRTVAATSQAENAVRAQRALLQSTEQAVLLNSATAYMDVARDRSVVLLTRSNEQVLRRDLEATRDRFKVGEVTRTDVAQAEAALAQATAQRIQAEGNLIASAARYVQQIGTRPQTLRQPTVPVPLLPANEAEAVAGSINNPDLISSQYNERSARDAVDVAFGQALPQVTLTGTLSVDHDIVNPGISTNTAQILAQVTIPLYLAGNVASQVRQAKQTASQLRLTIDQQRRAAAQTATTAWQQLQTARSQITSFKVQVQANQIALEGVRQEAQVGARTVLDVLDAEQALLTSQVNLVVAQHDEIVAAYSVIAAVGRLTARNLSLGVPLYDAEQHYHDVRDAWWGFGIDEKQ
jgi:TolC family type I secretion outer membrane protein